MLTASGKGSRSSTIHFRVDSASHSAQGWLFTPEALEFLTSLETRFIDPLLSVRADRQARRRDASGSSLDFPLPDPAVADPRWRVADAPPDLVQRIVELTGPVERKRIVTGLSSGADVFMADFEDATSPTWVNMISGQAHLYDAVRRQIDFTDPDSGKSYRLADRTATLVVRPRGLHLDEAHLEVRSEVDGGPDRIVPYPAALFDFGLFFFHNAAELIRRGSGPYFYLPKLEHRHEARFWNDVFLFAQEALGVPRGSIRATVLIETAPAAFQMEEILYELREHSAGLNCGRWDYIFSFIKNLQDDPDRIFPDRALVTMDQPFLRAYARRAIQICHRRGAPAIGGMAAFIPSKNDSDANAAALTAVEADKRREARDGHDGTWVAHPALIDTVRSAFHAEMIGPHQRHRLLDDVAVTRDELLAIPRGARTEEALRLNLRVGVQYLAAWLRGVGCVPLYGLMEDAATAEISRIQIWQWVKHRVALSDGSIVTAARARVLLAEELLRIRREVGAQHFLEGGFVDAARLFADLATAPEPAEFLTAEAYQRLIAQTANPDPSVPTSVRMNPALSKGTRVASVPRPASRPDPSAANALDGAAEKSHEGGSTPMVAIRPQHDAHQVSKPADRWNGVVRPYSAKDVEKLRGSVRIEYTLARIGANRLWDLLTSRDYVHALGALSGNQAVQMVRAGLEAIYCSGWQVAADANVSGHTYPDQSLYPANSVPQLVKRLNAALQRADQIEHAERLAKMPDGGANESDAVMRNGVTGAAYENGNVLRNGSANGAHENGNVVRNANGRHHDKQGGHDNGNGNGNGINGASNGTHNGTHNQAGGGFGRHSHGADRQSASSGADRDGLQTVQPSWFAPIIADAEAGFGGPLNAYELMKGMIEAGASAVHFEDQLSSEKKCGHLGGKVLVPTCQFIRTLVAARLAADVLDVPTLIIARTDADSAKLLTSDVDPRDRKFLTGERTPEGFYRLRGGLECAIARALAYAPYADLVWCETSTPDLEEARRFAEAVHAEFPGKMLAYNCSPSFNWKKHLDDDTIARFQRELGAMGYKFQFVTLAGFHQLNHGMYELARDYRDRGMAAYSTLQEKEFAAEAHGYTATRHQREVGTGYFDEVMQVVSGGLASTLALEDSTETAQF
jgi:malate synthase A